MWAINHCAHNIKQYLFKIWHVLLTYSANIAPPLHLNEIHERDRTKTIPAGSVASPFCINNSNHPLLYDSIDFILFNDNFISQKWLVVFKVQQDKDKPSCRQL